MSRCAMSLSKLSRIEESMQFEDAGSECHQASAVLFCLAQVLDDSHILETELKCDLYGPLRVCDEGW
jgi:hypothetical protein